MVEVSKDGLLPCPFCGGDPMRYTATDAPGFQYRQVQCKRCGANTFDLKWQNRVVPTTLQAERDRYRVLVSEAFEFLGGVDGAAEIRGRLLTALSDTPTVQS